jgi:tRNA(Phe) wybutosine-synthesizing methylase Tyw3
MRVLEELTTKEKVLTAKEYGKAVLYLANQDKFPATSNTELARLDQEIKESKDCLEERKAKLKEA